MRRKQSSIWSLALVAALLLSACTATDAGRDTGAASVAADSPAPPATLSPAPPATVSTAPAEPQPTITWPIKVPDATEGSASAPLVSATPDHLAYAKSEVADYKEQVWSVATSTGVALPDKKFPGSRESYTCVAVLAPADGGDVWVSLHIQESPAAGLDLASRTGTIVVETIDGEQLWSLDAFSVDSEDLDFYVPCGHDTAIDYSYTEASANGHWVIIGGLVVGVEQHTVRAVPTELAYLSGFGDACAALAGDFMLVGCAYPNETFVWNLDTNERVPLGSVDVMFGTHSAQDPTGLPIRYGVLTDYYGGAGMLVAFDLQSATVKWSVSGYAGGEDSRPAVSPDGRYLIADIPTEDSCCTHVAFDAATGAELWRVNAFVSFAGTDYAAFQTSDDQTVLVDARNGKQVAYDPQGKAWWALPKLGYVRNDDNGGHDYRVTPASAFDRSLDPSQGVTS